MCILNMYKLHNLRRIKVSELSKIMRLIWLFLECGLGFLYDKKDFTFKVTRRKLHIESLKNKEEMVVWII